MPPENKEAPAAAPPPAKKGGLIFSIAIIAVVLTVAIAAGLLTYVLVIQPALSKDETDMVETAAPPVSSANTISMAFDQEMASLTPLNPEWPAATLMYQVGFQVSTPEAAAIIETHKNHFASIVSEKHLGHTRDEADSDVLRRSIQQQIIIEANDLLKDYSAEPNDADRVLKVYHVKWFVHE